MRSKTKTMQVDELLAVGSVREEIGVLYQARREEPDNQEITFRLVHLLRSEGFDEEAFAVVKNWLRFHDDEESKRCELKILRELSSAKLAKSAAKRLLLNAPGDTFATSVLGWAMIGCGELTEGFRLLEEALAAHPEDSDIVFEYAAAHMTSGRPEAALRALQRAVESHRDDPQIRTYLGRAYRQIGNLEEANAQAAIAETLEGDSFRVLYLKGRIAESKGEYKTALEVGHQLEEKFGFRCEPHKLLAGAYLGLGKLESAAAHALKAVNAQPSNAEAHSLFVNILRKLPNPFFLKYSRLFLGARLAERLCPKSRKRRRLAD